MDSFVGRDDELITLGKLVRRARLVTLVGPGGTGKTRLALELISRRHDVRLVELAPLHSADLLVQTVAAALGVTEQTGEPITETIAVALGDRSVMIVLDNCEHLIDECASLAEMLLRRCPGVRILATSREAMRIGGETVFPVGELQLAGAAQLFLDRAQGEVAHTDVVDQICTRLDRLPLAIELAARLVPALPPEEILARLDNRLDLLTVGSRTCTSRHRNLRAAIDWSYDSLTATERLVFRTVSLLAGGFDLEAASAVCDVPPERLVGVVTALVAKSLVVPLDGRYRQLESIRLYGYERLVEAEEESAAKERTTRWLVKITRNFTDPVFTQAGSVERLVKDRENLAIGVRWAAEAGDECELLLATTLAVCWWSKGYTSKGRRLLYDALDRTNAPAGDRSLALTHAGWLASTEGDYAEALALTRSAVVAARSMSGRHQLGRALNALAGVYMALGEFARACDTYTHCLDLLDQPLDRATCLHNLSWAVLQNGDPDLAEELVSRALPVYRWLADAPKLPAILHTAGTLALQRGDPVKAETLFQEALQVAPDNVYELPYVVEGLAIVAAQSGEPERALRLLGAVPAQRGEQDPRWREIVATAEQQARDEMPSAKARAAVTAGSRLRREQLVAYARDHEWPHPELCASSPLTAREREIAALVAKGDTNRQIARMVSLSERTVEAHLNRIREKLGLRTRTQVATWMLTASA